MRKQAQKKACDRSVHKVHDYCRIFEATNFRAKSARQNGEGGIRTPGALRLNGFQDRRDRPLCHLSLN